MQFGQPRFAQDAQRVKSSLVHLDTLALNSRFSDHVRSSKGLALVWMAASVEAFWKSYLSDLCKCVANSSLSKRRRNLASVALFYFDSLGSMGEGKRLKRWERAADFFTGLPAAALPSPALPYDGRTVRPAHFEVVWKIFSLPGAEFPSPIHKQVLNTLADQRNDVAHGLVDAPTMGGTLTVDDLRIRLTRLEEIVEHSVASAAVRWL
jgi:hypothetical protein